MKWKYWAYVIGLWAAVCLLFVMCVSSAMSGESYQRPYLYIPGMVLFMGAIIVLAVMITHEFQKRGVSETTGQRN